MVLGIDVGGSTTKIVGFENGECVGMLQVEASDQITSAFGAFGKFTAAHNLRVGDIRKIAVTGVGASQLEKGMYDIPTVRIDEFIAIGLGGLKLAGLSEAYVVSVGTGTALVKAANKKITHLGGSGIGGGMLLNLCKRFAGVHSYNGIMETAKQGDLNAIDLRLRDISSEKMGNLSPDTTVANFGNLHDNASNADVVLGFLNVIFESIGMMAVFATLSDSVKDIVLTGALSATPHAATVFDALSKIHPVKFHIPQDAIFATAVGAALL